MPRARSQPRPTPHDQPTFPASQPERKRRNTGSNQIPSTTAQKTSARAGASLRVAASTILLDGLTTLDAETAKALATRKGPLSLPNLKKISPQTLSALIEKNDVEIPLIETLELIPEPDGSGTEDFVIPEGFQERQKRQQGR